MMYVIRRILDFISPRQCAICGRVLSVSEQSLCSACYMRLPRTGFGASPTVNEMAQLFWGLLPIERAAALYYYEAGSETADVVYHLKYHQQPEAAFDLGCMMATELQAAGFFDGIDALVAVPLSRRRQWQRGYNQSLLLAEGISEMTKIPVLKNCVRRRQFRKSQTSLSHFERLKNVEGLFVLTDAEKLKGKHLLLIDDVCTTGATLAACGAALCGAEGVTLSMLTLGFSRS